MSSAVVDRLLAPTPALADPPLSPPDEEGRRWRSRVRAVLKSQAAARGGDEIAVLSSFVRATRISAATIAAVEVGRLAPSAEYRRAAARALGVPEVALFEVQAGDAAAH